ncbi:MAG TPA: fibro-slime domain-containing protein, partial [Polyangiaceae bacterium]|nr:fibro-slime domain-containing protein [Polyangiaceae bacterium]
GTATTPQHGEGCDDGNTIAGDGCGPTCQKEPTVTVGTNPTVTTTCGDGILIKVGENIPACSDGNPANNTGCAEVCDDGNVNNGDGCTNECRVETGWSCVDSSQQPSAVSLKIKYRDFRGRWVDVDSGPTRTNLSGGHPQFGYYQTPEFDGGRQSNIVGALCVPGSGTNCGRLDSAGKPVLNTDASILGPVIPNDGSPLSANAFSLWYRSPENKAGANNSSITWGGGTVQVFDMGEASALSLTRQGTTDTYVFASTSFYPVDGQAFGNTPNLNTTSHNFHFTSEMRYFFKYEKRPDPVNVGQLLGQELQFYGDDDVWVFVNGRLAVDIGGVHGQELGRVVLGDEDSSCASTSATPPACDLTGAEEADITDNRFNITEGNLYEIVVFQAERSPTESNYKLTLSGFLPPRSTCSTTCGDERVGGPETCDEGFGSGNTGGDVNRNDEYGACNTSCTFSFCGDGVNDNKLSQDPADPEACDNGRNVDLYSTTHKTLAAITSSGLCAPACELPAYCGDGVIDFAHGEECDEGEGENNGEYGGCTSACKLAPYCGDGAKHSSESCDCGPGSTLATCPSGQFESYSDVAGGCGYDCQPAPYCGDNIRNGSENCDGTDVSGSRVCNANCDYDAVCGDGIKNTNEDCDHGTNNTADPGYEGCSDLCTLGPSCGDGTPDRSDGEECDLGEEANTGSYDGCTDACLEGPHCGDAVVQSQADEACDNGFNEDDYAYPGVTDACGANCTDVPFCGDNEVQDAFEFCDDGDDNSDTAYDGCTTQCVYGPYCGDGHLDKAKEKCDDGKDNVAYSADGAGCGYDCTPSPYCGDGVRNGPEQCDLGTDDNDGSYNGCNEDCTRAPYCGDHKVQEDENEQCDDGINGSVNCSNKCKDREGIIH